MGSRFSSRCPSQAAFDADANKPEKLCCQGILEDLQIRSMISAHMFYEQSNSYDKYYTYGTILSSVPTGLAAAQLSRYIPLCTGRYTAVAKTVIAFIMTTSSAYKLGSAYILDEWNEKRKLANEAGAAWQSLELKIRLFLCSMQKETTLAHCEKFTNTCIEKRKEICLIARADTSNYQNHYTDPSPTLEWYKKKKEIIEKMKSEIEKDEYKKQHEDTDTKPN